MTRRAFQADLIIDGEVLTSDTGFAFNSTIRKSEALVRAFARDKGEMFEGNLPTRIGDHYCRRWTSKTWEVGTAVYPA